MYLIRPSKVLTNKNILDVYGRIVYLFDIIKKDSSKYIVTDQQDYHIEYQHSYKLCEYASI
jgi:hypothetical protein